MRHAVVEAPPAERRLVKVVRRESWHSPDVRGDVVQRPVAAALRLVLLDYATPEGWQPTAGELREAAEQQFRALEKAREERGFSVAAWLKLPGIRRQYERVRQVLGEV